MMRFLRKGDCYALEKPIKKRYYLSLNSFQCLLLSLSTIYYQFSCNVQESRARGTTGEGEKSKKPAVMKPSWSMASVMSFNTLLIHCYYFEHTWRILRPYTKNASARVAGVFGQASKLGRTLVHICSTGVRLLFECCSSAVRVRVEAQSKASRRAPEGLPNKCRSRLEAQSKDCRRALEGLPNNSRSRVEELINRLSRFACNDGKIVNDLYMNQLILRLFGSFYEGVRGEVGSMLIKNKRSSQNGLNEADGFLLDKERADDIKKPMTYGLQLIAIFCVLFTFASVVEAKAQELRQGGATGIGEIKPLEIGDTVPEEIWNMPLQVVEYGGKTKEIRLADYRGKVIILDYWATWCAGCILSMPKMHELAEEMSRDVALLAVTRQDEQVVSRYLAITASKQMLQLRDSFSTIVSGDIMSDLIPHRSLPHIAIINKYGVLEQTTLPHLLNASILQAISAGGDYYLPINRSDVDTTLLSQTFPDIRHDKPIYYSTLMGYVDGFSAPSKHIVDSSANITRGYFINTSILRLMNIALQSKGIGLLPNRRIMLVDNPSDFDYFHERNPNYQRREFTVSYEYALPITWSREKINNRILSDIQDYRGLYVKMIRREVPCLVLKKKKDTAISEVQKGESSGEVINGVLAFSREQREVGLSSSGAKNYLRGVSIGALESILNNLKTGAVPFVINETGIDYNINLDLPDDLNDVGLLTEILEKQGILVVQERRELDIFVMHDKPIILHKVQSAELVLTKFGYVLEKEVDNG